MASRLQNVTSLTINVLQDITDDFSEERKIGQGTNGKVYVGIFNGEEIVVKMLNNTMLAFDREQLKHECTNLTRLTHHNIVQLVGYCYEIQYLPMQYNGKAVNAEKSYRALCYKYMQNGSLQKHLSNESEGLDWHTRYKIIKGTCEGLKYLHRGFEEESIYHLDLKPDNILLDKNIVPKLADFGLSKLFSDQTRITQSPVGTLDYMPMEYLRGNLVSNKFDIFSLGVVMIQIIAGPRGHIRSAGMPYQEFLYLVHENWRNRLQATCHASRSLEAYCEQVSICTEIALRCMEIDRHKRPNITDIIHQLNGTELNIAAIIHQLKDTEVTMDKKGSYTPELGSLTMRLLQEITNNFSEERLIGQGGYGKVYKAVLENREEVAVKLLHNNNTGIDDELFEREFEILPRLEHHNIIRLLGYCYKMEKIPTEFKGRIVLAEKTDRAMCFEYMKNGSLQKHLCDEFDGLNWQTRYKIIKGTCEGLKYLQGEFASLIFHLDLKPDNILLDEDMVPKLADFGLSKQLGNENTRITKGATGTFGYMPPEYINGYIISSKSDIFSLGVVMTQIIAGPKGHIRLADMPYHEFLGQVNKNWRSRLKATWNSSGSLEAYCKQVNICTTIALRCMEDDRHKRPSIVDIIDELNETEAATDKGVRKTSQTTHLKKELKLANREAKEAAMKFEGDKKPLLRLIAVKELLKEKELELDQLRSELQRQREAGKKEKKDLRQLLESKTREVEDLENKVKVLGRDHEKMKKNLEDRIRALEVEAEKSKEALENAKEDI